MRCRPGEPGPAERYVFGLVPRATEVSIGQVAGAWVCYVAVQHPVVGPSILETLVGRGATQAEAVEDALSLCAAEALRRQADEDDLSSHGIHFFNDHFPNRRLIRR